MRLVLKMRKASADMWWIIIGAVIALVVLVVLLSIFSGKTGNLEQGLSSCESKGGVCVSEENPCPGSTIATPTFECNGQQNCCIGVPKSCQDDSECSKGSKCRNFGNNGDKFYCT